MVDSLTGRRDKDRLGTDKDRDSQGQWSREVKMGQSPVGNPGGRHPSLSLLVDRAVTEGLGGYGRDTGCAARPGSQCPSVCDSESGVPG